MARCSNHLFVQSKPISEFELIAWAMNTCLRLSGIQRASRCLSSSLIRALSGAFMVCSLSSVFGTSVCYEGYIGEHTDRICSPSSFTYNFSHSSSSLFLCAMLSFTQFVVLALGAIPFASSAPVRNTTSSSWVFPVALGRNSQSWSTSSLVANPRPLNDNTLNIYSRHHPLISTLFLFDDSNRYRSAPLGSSGPHAYTNAPDGSASMQAVYQQGSISPGHTSTSGGFSLYAKGPIDLSQGTEITFSYSAYFENGFDFNKGGKMPGLYGGTTDQVAITCSGGRHDPACWVRIQMMSYLWPSYFAHEEL